MRLNALLVSTLKFSAAGPSELNLLAKSSPEV